MLKLGSLEPQEVAQLIPVRPIFVGYRGSLAHGTHVPPEDPKGIDDIDIIVCYIPKLSTYFGLGAPPKGIDVKVKEWDCAAYELRHFVSLLTKGNPNVLSTLWLDQKHILHTDREWKYLIENRDLFATKKVFLAFGGYAMGQFKRMTHFDPQAILDDSYVGRGSKKAGATGFMGEKRKALVKEHGYDTKNAAHLIRLLRQGVEFLKTGSMQVDRTNIDVDELIAIKKGALPLLEVDRLSKSLFKELDEAAKASSLPDAPDDARIEKLLVGLLSLAKSTEVVLEARYFNTKPIGNAL